MEKDLERKIVKDLKSLGCKVAKFIDQSEKGAPDRLAVLPTGLTIYVETKFNLNGLSEHQKHYQEELKKRKAFVFNVRNEKEWSFVLNNIKNIIKHYSIFTFV